MTDTANPPATGTALRCEHLSVSIGRHQILADIGVEVGAGEWLGVIGPNGAGKSTLLRSIAGLIDHDGTIRLADGSAPTVCHIALVPQNPHLPPGMSVAEYVLLGRTAHLGWLARESKADRRIAGDALARLDLEGFADRRVDTLSGGEAQRTVIARALAQQAPILLLDEPTSALDLGHQESVLELVDGLRRTIGLTVIAAMHDLTTAARFCDRMVLLDSGRVASAGSPSEVLTAQRLFDVYGTAVSVQTIDGELVVLPAPRRMPPT